MYEQQVRGLINGVKNEIQFNMEEASSFAGLGKAIRALVGDDEEGIVTYFIYGNLNVTVVDTSFYLE